MATEVERISKKSSVARKTIVGFSPDSVRASFMLRCGALIIDYLFVIATPVIFLLIGRYFGSAGSELLNGELNNIGWLVALCVALADIFILPMVLGQSVGKMFTGIRIVARDGSDAGSMQILGRQSLGYLVVILTLGLGFIYSAFDKYGRGLHDILFGTIVIQGHKEAVD